ncbi:MAG: HAD family phosphatase [Cyanobacteria bacterium J06639_16]
MWSSSLPTAVIFDMDGLMLDSEVIFKVAWQRAGAALGYSLSDELYDSLVGRSNREVEVVFCQTYGDGFPVLRFRQLWGEFWEQQVKTTGVAIKPGLLELLDFLEQHQIPKAVGTSSEWKEADLSLKTAGIFHRFKTIVTVDQAGAGKPAPDIFLMALDRLSVAPQDCLVFEDSNAGVKAAHAAGIPVIMVPDLQTPSAESKAIAAHISSSLDEAVNWLRWPSEGGL